LDQVKASRICRCDLTAFGQDHVEQPHRVSFGGKGNSDVIQLLQTPQMSVSLTPDPLNLLPHANRLKEGAQFMMTDFADTIVENYVRRQIQLRLVRLLFQQKQDAGGFTE